MAKQQTKRRRKRYVPGSAYAGHVRPTGVLGFMGSSGVVRLIFILMALALVGGGFGACLRGQGGGSTDDSQDFVFPGDEDASDATTQPDATEAKRYAGPPDMSIDPTRRYVATIKTEQGDIEVELFAGQAPQTVNNFVFLARDGFYDGLSFHYVSPGFSAQAGDPTGTGSGGPGYELEQEATGPFQVGTIGMANGSQQSLSNGSQFFIALSDSPSDSERYEQFTPFGQITAGLDVAEQLTVGTEIQTIEIREQ